MSRKRIINAVLFYWFPFVGYLSLIFYLSHHSDPTSQIPLNVNDKLLHGTEFFILEVLAVRAFCGHVRDALARHRFFIGATLFSFVYAVSDEFHQFFVPGRIASGTDLLADITGICIAAGMMKLLYSTAERTMP